MNNRCVFVSHISVKLPYYVAGVMLQENAVYVTLYAKLGLTVTWNREDAVMVISATKLNTYRSGLRDEK